MKDFKWIEKRFGSKFTKILKEISDDATEAGKEIDKYFEPEDTGGVTFTDSHGNDHELLTPEAISDNNYDTTESALNYAIARGLRDDDTVQDEFTDLLANKSLIEVTWQQLKNLRDNSNLIPGSLYRITDYQCTTTQAETRSAGNQFDIVLLALNNNVLSEQGWAMMSMLTNIWSVHFSDGIIKECYLYNLGFNVDEDENVVAIIDKSTMLGCTYIESGFYNFNYAEKSCFLDDDSLIFTDSGLQHDYFQNCKLEAWKVWYSLDNDTTRFAWADDGEIPTIGPNSNFLYQRYPEGDTILYCWKTPGTTAYHYTKSEFPKIGDGIYIHINGEPHTSIDNYDYDDPVGVVSGFGRGVIYRMIDEFNNDCPYDFKNIQFNTKVSDGLYNSNGNYRYVYTFSIYNYNVTPGLYLDGSIISGTLLNQGDVLTNRVENNIITKYLSNGSIDVSNLSNPNILFGLMSQGDDQTARIINVLLKDSEGCKLNSCNNIMIYYSRNIELSNIEQSSFYVCNKVVVPFNPTSHCIMIKNKKVLVES